MTARPIFFQPVFKERIWGGRKLATDFGFSLPDGSIGECWGISAHPEGESLVKDGEFAGKTLSELWSNHAYLFGSKREGWFPLLIKILDAQTDLSVQVHPDDRKAQELENQPFGKTECWYIVDCEPDSQIILGHHAQTREELESMIAEGEWDHLLKQKSVQPGDFIYVPSGTIHAIKEGIVILETQQTSDITYRVYDYDRTDDTGAKRELHLEKSIEVTTVPDQPVDLTPNIVEEKGLYRKHWDMAPFFGVEEWIIDGETKEISSGHTYSLCSVLEGEGSILLGEESISFRKGDFFLLPHGLDRFRLTGSAKWIISYTG
ncbi:mannose-6-phosphate isomerase, class I [Risungbinella massiliensis]|uniref:mannose-6-phosphate isomerase, class I n=1 Tax=Risungbinella massiliensis TaxID=1329796 RepID=UPI0005CC2D13|nr:mannose-6-phosphate isomerase, class I [Risungbinella massiliensis]